MAVLRRNRLLTTILASLIALPAIAQSFTHLGLPYEDHITLVLRFDATTQCPSGRAFYERFPSGTYSSTEFRVPGGEIFVITDFRWQVVPDPAAFASNSTLESVILSRFGNQSFRIAYTSNGVNLTPDFGSMNRIAGNDHITAGVQVGSARYLCASAQSRTANFTAFHTVVSAEISGYMLKK